MSKTPRKNKNNIKCNFLETKCAKLEQTSTSPELRPDSISPFFD